VIWRGFWGVILGVIWRVMPKVNLKTHLKKSCSRSVFTVTCFQLDVVDVGFPTCL
jgi:hypothetical protein